MEAEGRQNEGLGAEVREMVPIQGPCSSLKVLAVYSIPLEKILKSAPHWPMILGTQDPNKFVVSTLLALGLLKRTPYKLSAKPT